MTVAGASSQPGFSWNAETIVGIVGAFLGSIMYFMTKDTAGNWASQGFSILQSGGLSSTAYVNLWGFVFMLMGIPAIIGGIIKGATHHRGGGALKSCGLVLAVVYGLACSFIFANAAAVAGQTAAAVITGDTSLSDLESFAQLVRIIPWLAGGLYVIGILINGGSKKQSVKGKQ